MEFFLGAFENDWERRRAAILHERSLGRSKAAEDEARRRRGSVVAVAPRGRLLGNGSRHEAASLARGGAMGGAVDVSMRSRFKALASGSQPAVVKLASFGGGGRLGAMISYVSRGGEIVVENERGDQLQGRDELSAVGVDWSHLMKNRAESRDIGSFELKVVHTQNFDGDPYEHARALLKRGLGDRSFAFAVRVDGQAHTVEGVTVLRDSQGERLTADSKATDIVGGRIAAGAEDGVSFRFTGYGNGTDFGTSRLRDMVSRHDGAVQTETGRSVGDAKQAGDLVQLEWRAQLHSRKSRDVMHLIVSARAGTDIARFQAAARDFLAQEFAGHRYVFALHDPGHDPKPEQAGGKRPHVHVHAVVATRRGDGERLGTTIGTFRQWRLTMAEKARQHGIDMEMTDRRERASAPAYGQNQVRPTGRRGRTEHEPTSAASRSRYEAKRSDHRNYPRSEVSVDYSYAARREWQNLVKDSVDKSTRDFAQAQIHRLDEARGIEGRIEFETSGDGTSYSDRRTKLVKSIGGFREEDGMRQMTRQEFALYEKQVETALVQAESVVPPSERTDFDEIASAARDHVRARRELIELQERTGERAMATNEADRQLENDANARWDGAVARHGQQTAEAANDVMLKVEHFRDAIELAQAGEIKADKVDLQASLNLELARAAELGAAGNGLVREIAEVDTELRIALEAAERSRGRNVDFKRDGRDTDDASPQNGSASLEPGEQGSHDRSPAPAADRDNHSPLERPVEREAKSSGDTMRSEPAQQHIPRLEQLQSEADEERERGDRDSDRQE